MTEAQKLELERALWGIANDLRGKMDADEFRDYILGFIFFKYLSERLELYGNDILEPDGVTFADIREGTEEGEEILEAVRAEAVEELGYFLKPTELFTSIAQRGARKGDNFILDDLTRILENIQKSTMGAASEEDFNHLFEDMDLGSTKLGRTVSDRNDLVAKIPPRRRCRCVKDPGCALTQKAERQIWAAMPKTAIDPLRTLLCESSD